MSYISWGVGVAVAVMTVAAPVRAEAGCEWKPEVLSLPDDAEQGKVTAGDGGWLAGVAWGESASQGVLWHDGQMTVLGAAFGLDTYLHAVNSDGVAVGRTGSYHAIRYRNGGYEYLPEAAGSSKALDVNARGDAVGYDGATRIVVWQADGSVRALPMPPGEFPSGWPVIDDDGSVVAWTGFVDAGGTFRWRGYTWAPDGTRTPLSSFAVAVNRVPDDSSDESLLWSPGEVPVPLPAPADHRAGGVVVLDDDQAGGYSFPVNESGSRPVRWLCR